MSQYNEKKDFHKTSLQIGCKEGETDKFVLAHGCKSTQNLTFKLSEKNFNCHQGVVCLTGKLLHPEDHKKQMALCMEDSNEPPKKVTAKVAAEGDVVDLVILD